MSRIGKAAIKLPSGVKIIINKDSVNVSGQLGSLDVKYKNVKVKQEQENIIVEPIDDSNESKKMWGLHRSLVSNAVKGVTEGYEIRLEIRGVGYRASMTPSNSHLVVSLGYSHPILVEQGEFVNITCEKPTLISIKGTDKQKVGETASRIMKLRRLDPYKGKGIVFEGQKVETKAGKKK